MALAEPLASPTGGRRAILFCRLEAKLLYRTRTGKQLECEKQECVVGGGYSGWKYRGANQVTYLGKRYM